MQRLQSTRPLEVWWHSSVECTFSVPRTTRGLRPISRICALATMRCRRRTMHSAPSNVSQCSCPRAGRPSSYQDLTQTTPADIDAWIAAAFQQGLAPGTIVTCRRGLQGFFGFLCDHGVLAQSPIQLPRHQILAAHAAPPADGGSRDRRVLSGDRCARRPHDISVDAAVRAPRERSEPRPLGGDRPGAGYPAGQHQ